MTETLATDGALLAYNNRALGHGQVTGTVGTWTTTPPIDHLLTEQVPIPFAQVTPDTGVIEFDYTAHDREGQPEAFTLDICALLAHSAADDIEYRPGLPPGAVVKFIDDETELASIEYQPVPNRNLPPDLYAVLTDSVELQTLTVRIENAGTSPIRIGGLWAGDSIRFRANRGKPSDITDFARIGRVAATRWPNRRAIARTWAINAGRILADQATGTEGGRNFEGVFEEVGESSPVIYIHRISTQANINLTALYGYLTNPRVTHRSGPVHAVQFGVEEMR
jgi:hypothetical protein